MGARPGEDAPHAKLTWPLVRLIRMVWEGGNVTMAELARLAGVSYQTIQKVVRYETWRDPPEP